MILVSSLIRSKEVHLILSIRNLEMCSRLLKVIVYFTSILIISHFMYFFMLNIDESMDVEQNTLSEICALETCSGRVRYDPQLQTNFPRCRDEYIVSTYNPNATSLGSDAIHGGNNMPQHAAQSSEFNLHAYAGKSFKKN